MSQSIVMANSGMMLHLAFTLVLFSCLSFIHGQEVIYIVGAQLKGTIMTTRNGRNISAYLGIPYAEAPIGPLRFKEPRRWKKFDQVLSADTDGDECPQFNDDGKLVGKEDCLFLNIYTPDTYPEEPYPVMVYFHGGEKFFSQGSGSSKNAGPEYLLDKDIVLVTVNYRLGVLGFLSTGDAEATGNFGLKDQAFALNWVRDNILSFGGHPYRVTIFGQGAGGASTSLHAIFNPSMFEQYISQSGNAMAFWSFQDLDTYTKRAFDLGNHVKCPTSNSHVLVDCLRNVDAYDLVDSDDIFNNSKWILNTWGPTLEHAEFKDAFITEAPVNQIANRGIKACPAIFGNVLDEGLLWTAALYANDTLYNSMTKNLFDYLKYVVAIFFDRIRTTQVATETQDFYFNSSETTDDKNAFIQNLTNFLTDAAFRVPLDLQIRYMEYVTKSPIYLYAFDYRGTFSKTSDTLGNNDNVGVTHGDDLIYLFPVKTSNSTLSDSDNKMIDIMVDFWTSFANTGIPTSEHTSDPNVWKPYENSEDATDGKLLKIGDDSDPTDIKEYEAFDDRLEFWSLQLENQVSGIIDVGK